MLQWKRILTSNSFCVPSEEAVMFMLGYVIMGRHTISPKGLYHEKFFSYLPGYY